LPHGFALLGERPRPFLGVLGTQHDAHLTSGSAPAGLIAGDHAVVDPVGHSLTRRNREWRIARDALSECQRGVDDRAIGHHLIDQPPSQCIGGRHRLAGEHQLQRHLARQLIDDAEHPARGGDQPSLDLGEAELRLLLCDHEIARECQFGATAESGAVHRGDGGLVDEVLHVAREAPLAVVGVVDVLPPRDRLEIGACAKGLT
jgi:hypothetical protein